MSAPARYRTVAITTDERDALMAARRDRGIRVKVLARQLWITPSILAKWQNGTRSPSHENLLAWWRAVM